MSIFYIMDGAFLTGTISLDTDVEMELYKFSRGEQFIEPPILYKKYAGKRLYDYLEGGVALFHNRFFDALRQNNVSGFDSVPAIIKIGKELNHDYSCLIVKGRVYHEDVMQGDVINYGPYVIGGTDHIIKKGLYFDESTWDGSDIFFLDGKGYMLITEKVKKIIEDLKLTNVTVISKNDIERPVSHFLDPDVNAYLLAKLEQKK